MTRSPRLYTALGIVAIDLVGFGVVLPVIPFLASQWGASTLKIGFLFSVYSLMQFIFSPFWGSLSDRIGRRPVLLISTLGNSAGYLAFAFSPSYAALLAARAFSGAMAGNIAATQSYISDVTDEKNRTSAMGLFGAAFGLGFVLGPALAGILLLIEPRTHLPHVFTLIGLVASLLSFISFVFTVFFLPESRPERRAAQSTSARRSVFSFAEGLRSPDLRAGFLLTLLLTLAQAILYSIFPEFLTTFHRMSPAEVSRIYAIMGILAILLQGFVVRRVSATVSDTRLLAWGILAFAAGLILLPEARNLTLLFSALFLMTLGPSLATPGLQSLISKRAGEGRIGQTLGLNQSFSSLGRVLGPSWGGWLYGYAHWLPFIATALPLLTGLWFFIRFRSPHQTSSKNPLANAA